MVLPSRHETIQQGHKASIVRRLQQMHHFVDNDVLKALSRFFGQVGVQANAGSCRITTTPSRFHPLNKKTLDLHSQVLFPSRDQLRRKQLKDRHCFVDQRLFLGYDLTR